MAADYDERQKIKLIAFYTILCGLLFSVIPLVVYHYFAEVSPVLKVLFFVGCSGGLGGITYSIVGFSKHIILRDFDLSYGWWYFYRPLTAAIIGVFGFFFIVGGLIGLGLPPQAQQNAGLVNGFTQTNTMFFCAISFLAGFASNEFMAKLENVAETLFTVVPKTSEEPPALPSFTARREGENIVIVLDDMRGAKSVRGLHVVQPAINKPDLTEPPDADLAAGQNFLISGLAVKSETHLVATSNVSGHPRVVIDTIV